MAEDKTMLLVLALVAMVAIVAAFGIVNMTGFVVARNGQAASIESIEIIEESSSVQCMRQTILYWTIRQNGCFQLDQLEQSACLRQAKYDLEIAFRGCMNGNGGPIECYAGVGCADVCCEGYTGYGCALDIGMALCPDGQTYCQPDCAIPGTLPDQPV